MTKALGTDISTLWRRLDVRGHDACRLTRTSEGWRLAGSAVFDQKGQASTLAYELICDEAWRSVRGSVRGFIGPRVVNLAVERDGGAWRLNGRPTPGLEHAIDLDFSITPATNLPQLQRIALGVGDAADVPAAWLNVEAGDDLVELRQRYERRTTESYWYVSSADYEAVLELKPDGFVRLYPGLWEAEPPVSQGK